MSHHGWDSFKTVVLDVSGSIFRHKGWLFLAVVILALAVGVSAGGYWVVQYLIVWLFELILLIFSQLFFLIAPEWADKWHQVSWVFG
uniref:hypothetical protein n=1 Tax=Thaumasiovibrio occultus TaxID=1891184 RepID=UPI000B35BE34|nr:hypothetical protein [Thaumasiovibrio occultus]